MKILVLSDFYPPCKGGGHHIQCKIIAEGLAERGHEVSVLTSQYGVTGNNEDDKHFRVLKVLPFECARGIKRKYLNIKTGFLGRINYFITRRIIKKTNPDIVYVGYIRYISAFPLKAIQNRGIPAVYHLGSNLFVQYVKDCILEKNLFKRLWRKLISGFYSLKEFDFNHNMITVSEALKKEHIAAGFPESNISVIPRGISPELINNRGKCITATNKNQIKILYIGRMIPEKGVHIAISAIGHLVNRLGVKNVQFDLFGNGSDAYIENLKNLTHNLKIEKHVKFHGKVDRGQLLKIYQDYDLFLLPSIFQEPFGVVLIEAMARGVPVVATDTGGIPEVISHEVNGLLVSPEDSIKMAEAVKRLIDNPLLAQKLSNNGIRTVREKFNQNRIIVLIENYLKKKVYTKNGWLKTETLESLHEVFSE